LFLISWYKKRERDILGSHAIYNIEFVMHPVCMDAIALSCGTIDQSILRVAQVHFYFESIIRIFLE
jgi:hypothetical protein